MPRGGQFEGEQFRCRRQPFAGLFLEQVELAERGEVPWTDFVAMGPTQSGKTTLILIAMMYALFELKENVIFGIPTSEMAGKKWRKDIKPLIASSQYADLMPVAGPGSQGGDVSAVYFKNGTSLLFMTSGGGREQRSSDTARWLMVTEADSFSEVDSAGGEGRKIDQLIARTHSFGHRRRVFAECTVTTDSAFVWDTYKKKSSESVIVSQCRGCGEWVRFERHHLVGWQEGQTQIESGRLARWTCEKCGILLDEADRQEAVSRSKLIHKGQTINGDGEISGPIPETRTLGFRWNAWDNRLAWTTSFIAETEFAASKAKDQDAAGIMLGQFYWALPRESDAVDQYPLELDDVRQRRDEQWIRGLVPADSQFVTMGLDIGKHNLHWTLIAARPNDWHHVVDYGIAEVSQSEDTSFAIRKALQAVASKVGQGWPVSGCDAVVVPEQVFVDSGWGDYADLIYIACRDMGIRYRAIKGYGFGQGRNFGDTNYTSPDGKTKKVMLIGGGWHIAALEDKEFEIVHLDANYWKTRCHSGLSCKMGENGALTICSDGSEDRTKYDRHLLSEKPMLRQELVEGKGWQMRHVWVRQSKVNHWFDSTCYGLAAADFVRTVRAARAANSQGVQVESREFAMPDGTPFFVGARA